MILLTNLIQMWKTNLSKPTHNICQDNSCKKYGF